MTGGNYGDYTAETFKRAFIDQYTGALRAKGTAVSREDMGVQEAAKHALKVMGALSKKDGMMDLLVKRAIVEHKIQNPARGVTFKITAGGVDYTLKTLLVKIKQCAITFFQYSHEANLQESIGRIFRGVGEDDSGSIRGSPDSKDSLQERLEILKSDSAELSKEYRDADMYFSLANQPFKDVEVLQSKIQVATNKIAEYGIDAKLKIIRQNEDEKLAEIDRAIIDLKNDLEDLYPVVFGFKSPIPTDSDKAKFLEENIKELEDPVKKEAIRKASQADREKVESENSNLQIELRSLRDDLTTKEKQCDKKDLEEKRGAMQAAKLAYEANQAEIGRIQNELSPKAKKKQVNFTT